MKTISIIIPAKDKNDPKLKECLHSIEMQKYPKELVETLIITEGTPESAKAIGLKKATGEIVCFMGSDCEFTDRFNLVEVDLWFKVPMIVGAYSQFYSFDKVKSTLLNRYFALFGFNDPVPFYLGKCDRYPFYTNERSMGKFFPYRIPTLGDNGFFVRKELIMQTDLEHYSHIDNCEDLRKLGYYYYIFLRNGIYHKTGDSIWQWIKKRFHYAESLNKNRRWKMIEKRDWLKLALFLIFSITLLEPIGRSIYGYLKSGIKDKAWFLHPVICFITVWVYGALCLKRVLLYVVKIVHRN